MNLYFRLLWLVVSYLLFGRRETLDVTEPCRTSFRVLPTDLDLYGHVNNGRYFPLFDLGRIDHAMQSGQFAVYRRRGWYPIVTSETIQFYEALTFPQKFTVETSILGWDDRSWIAEQKVFRMSEDGDEQVIAEGIVRGLILKWSGGRVNPEEVAQLVGRSDPSPALPEWVADWIEAQDRARGQRRQ